METFFNPRAIAVVGANQKNLGNFVVKNLVAGFKGGIYPINPNHTEIEGLPCVASVTDIPVPVDLAIILVPAQAVASVLEACARKKITRVIIESAGFSETGPEGASLQAKCNDIANANGIRLWGPNCMGLVDVVHRKFFTFMNPAIRDEDLLPGKISLIVQSGMLSAIFLAELGQRGIGVAKACSIGNRADIDECDVVEYLLKDDDTDVIAMYLESIPRGRKFSELMRQSAKPCVLLKGGSSRAGAIAAMSHTCSLSGNSRLLNSVLALSGVTMASSIFQMMDLANTLSLIPHLNPKCRAAVLTLSGGAGILVCDALEQNGITIAELSEQAKTEISQVFPPWMPVANPIDIFPGVAMFGRMKAFMTALNGALKDPNVDVLIVHLVTGLGEDIKYLDELKQTADQLGKVIVVWLMGRKDASLVFREEARRVGIPVFKDATRIGECLNAVARYNAYRSEHQAATAPESPPPLTGIKEPLPLSPKTWDEFDSKRFLAGWNIPVVPEILVTSLEEACTVAPKIGWPLVLKGLVPGQTHKTELGLVKLGITDLSVLADAFNALHANIPNAGRILLQKQIAYDYELIAGFIHDNQFGPCIMFGLGGILAELEPDVRFALAPLSVTEALALVRGLRNKALLTGFRNIPPLNDDTMAQLLIDLGNIGTAYPQISQIDINPLVVREGMPIAVDANIILMNNTD